jgi:biopolymer transport protein ExbB/TolQ
MQQFLNFIVDGFTSPGSLMMWGILFLGFGVIALVAERVYYLFVKCGTGSRAFMNGISRYLKGGDYDKALKYASSVNTPLAKSITAILKNRGKSSKQVQKSVDEVFLTEGPKVTRNIAIINILANLSTMTGLTGTIYGLMMAFDAIANVPAAQRAQALATGISVAMATTLFGLVIAVPALLAQGILASKSDKVMEEMDEKSAKLINLVEE